ncbi:lanC-like protein 2 isoform X3 [Electrophorus electricus]|uniref:lanC-like protein 2 isoform X3 n=1 Tax=Electrophorus electricus TaxID=8005 RepID=UPI0015D02E94|nr:lanC-like protein 2 isoform X3 [Electrophorus electricus]
MGDNMSKRLKLVTGSESEMEERSFVNPFPDWDQGILVSSNSGANSNSNDPFDSNGKFSEAFQKKVQNKIKDLLQQMEEGLKTADPHDFSTYTGWTGISLLYLQLHRVSYDSSHLQRALDYVKRTLRNLNGRRITFLCGDAGPLAVAAVIHHHLKNQAESKECVAKLLQLQRSVISQDTEIPDELLYGRAGYLYALLYVNKEIGPDTVDDGTIAKVVTAILESGKNLSKEEKKTERCPLLYEWHKKQYVGAAHGLAGIYYMLLQPLAKVNPDILSELVRPSIDYVRHKRFRSGNYPSSLSNDTDRLVHWCHGAPGIVHMLIMAHKFAEWCLDYGTHGCRIPDRPYSLFEGMAGAIHFLSDLTHPEASCFPAFEL